MPRIKLDAHLYDRVKKIAEIAGYSSADEFIIHIIEKELDRLEPAGFDEKQIEERLRGLGYIE
jgi:metal-responsive CopG/Arc/MetJ family transcriptional regulator